MNEKKSILDMSLQEAIVDGITYSLKLFLKRIKYFHIIEFSSDFNEQTKKGYIKLRYKLRKRRTV